MVDHNPMVGDEYLLPMNSLCPVWIDQRGQNQSMDELGISLPSVLLSEGNPTRPLLSFKDFSPGNSHPAPGNVQTQNDFPAAGFPYPDDLDSGFPVDVARKWDFFPYSDDQTRPPSRFAYSPPPAENSHGSSRYLGAVQEMLSEIARYSLENVNSMCFDPTSYSDEIGGAGAGSAVGFPDHFGGGAHGGIPRVDAETKRKHLLALLQAVDDRYNQCMEELHMVVYAFHAATDLPHTIASAPSTTPLHPHLALQTVTLWYKNLRDRIGTSILAMGSHGGASEEKFLEVSSSASVLQRQWTTLQQQQQRKKDHHLHHHQQLWRPQRGLPERSVAVLRAWMFQNFLHPYPKDTEKHLLAVKSGLTRSQVSNWFINARVRLWKPMIEEMYAEMNRRNRHQNAAEQINGFRNQICLNE
ncbi:hypothetical protein DM860_000678 [Cuscuta australis]|uniref:Homeobox domain-containing protein n=1 Tax=Cuscuta australis TaxID=267555 RepID=A0A328CXM3_9ASTE|nr:hypothetical protein DM860_000678 [Cuscuta australis]